MMVRRRSLLRDAISDRRRIAVGFMPLWFGRGAEFKDMLDEADDCILWLQHGPMFADAVEWTDVGAN